jgi:hypothetical protein
MLLSCGDALTDFLPPIRRVPSKIGGASAGFG